MKTYQWALIGVAGVTAVAAYVSAPYVSMLGDYAELRRLQDDGIPLDGIDQQILDIGSDFVARDSKSSASTGAPNPDRNAYFGDLHVHTALSFDAYSFGTTASPSDAYRFARGEAIKHPSGFDMQLNRPLDFYAVTDHAMFLGVVPEAADTSTEISQYEFAKVLHGINDPENDHWTKQARRYLAFGKFLPAMVQGVADGSIDRDLIEGITKDAWQQTIDAADAFYEPGEFTTFVGYEYTTSSNDFGNLHRNVIFRGSEKLPAIPFSRFHSQNPEGLWDWMDELREDGVESLAIPHNSNGSNGQMFKLEDWAGDPLDDAYAEQRLRNEPLVEITQVKGTSDTHPFLSTNDEWADFEIMRFRVATALESSPPGSYVRDALLRGMALEEEGVINPYKFGVIGSSDTHVAASSLNEETYHSKVGLVDARPQDRGSVPVDGVQGAVFKAFTPTQLQEVDGESYISNLGFAQWGASGLAGVWAEENTRESIYDAFRRKETFATTGPRIKIRFFAGYGWTEDLLNSPNLVSTAYEQGSSMGSDILASEEQTPSFLVWTVRDALGVPLQRAQIIKGYVKAGEHFEAVYDIACSDGLIPDPQTHRCPDNGATVDLSDCSVDASRGANELMSVWKDPDFDPQQDAFYYVRVLENPTCRWSTWDAIRLGRLPRSDLAATVQERAWSSPIWYKNRSTQ